MAVYVWEAGVAGVLLVGEIGCVRAATAPRPISRAKLGTPPNTLVKFGDWLRNAAHARRKPPDFPRTTRLEALDCTMTGAGKRTRSVTPAKQAAPKRARVEVQRPAHTGKQMAPAPAPASAPAPAPARAKGARAAPPAGLTKPGGNWSALKKQLGAGTRKRVKPLPARREVEAEESEAAPRAASAAPVVHAPAAFLTPAGPFGRTKAK